MPSTTAMIKIGILILSFIVGIGFFYFTNQASKQDKKQGLDQFISYMINFILFIWAGKILIHIKIFIQDPFAVLAYPSDSKAVYIATVLLILQIVYHKFRKQLSIIGLTSTMIPMFIASSFMYEFLQMVVMDRGQVFPNLLLMTMLLLLYLFIQDKLSTKQIALMMAVVYSGTHLVLYFVYGYTVIFGYMLHPIYFISICLFIVGIFIYDRQKGRREV